MLCTIAVWFVIIMRTTSASVNDCAVLGTGVTAVLLINPVDREFPGPSARPLLGNCVGDLIPLASIFETRDNARPSSAICALVPSAPFAVLSPPATNSGFDGRLHKPSFIPDPRSTICVLHFYNCNINADFFASCRTVR